MKHGFSGRGSSPSAAGRWVPFLLGMAVALATASAPAEVHDETLILPYGTREIPGTAAELGLRTTLLRRENYNAHGFDVLFVHSAGPAESPEQQQLVPFFKKDGESVSLRTHEGADCVLRDFRLRVSLESDLVIVVAERELRTSYFEELPVRFREFTLHRNPENLPGWPSLYFEETRSWQTESSYCDVGEALMRELGLAKRR